VKSVTLPWPPVELSPNARVHWATKSRATKKYRNACCLLATAERLKAEEGELAMTVTFCPPDRRSYDDDNLIARFKAGRDGVADALGVDDRLFRPVYAQGEPVKGGAVVISIECVDGGCP
jgi:crossover junction endodeoxyribonuclease RusA